MNQLCFVNVLAYYSTINRFEFNQWNDSNAYCPLLKMGCCLLLNGFINLLFVQICQVPVQILSAAGEVQSLPKCSSCYKRVCDDCYTTSFSANKVVPRIFMYVYNNYIM